jgi:hypothetical protein
MRQITLTPAARTFAAAQADTLAAQMVNDLASTYQEEEFKEEYLDDLIMHTFKLEGHEYIMYHAEDGLTIDICNRVEADDPIEKGPFKGMKLSMPSPRSEDD